MQRNTNSHHLMNYLSTIRSQIILLIRRLASVGTWDQWKNHSWSQEGEDLILRIAFDHQANGFYVDVGAHHPKRFSNSYLFYRRGWSGINIDAMPGSMIPFFKMRPRDINLELGISTDNGTLDYYVFNESALNGFSKEVSVERHNASSPYKIEKILKIRTAPLSTVLDQHMPASQEIDFMSIDVEGLDFDVLNSNDWSKYRPKMVLVEVLASSLHEISESNIGRLMHEVGYELYAKCANTVFFRRADWQ